MIVVRVKYYNNDGHFAIEGCGKFQALMLAFGLPDSKDWHCKQCIRSVQTTHFKTLAKWQHNAHLFSF